MTKISLTSDAKNFKADASSLVETWLNLILGGQYQEAGELCTNFIENYGSVLRKRALELEENEYNNLLILLIFFKGLHECVQLCQITENENWYEDNATVEHAWIKLCDCRERLEFSSQYCQGEARERVVHYLDRLEKFFQDEFGSGSYFSPGIVADKSLCSICHQDFRACSHVTGRLYNGKICFYQPVNPQINHVALVETPKDARCRIWPWRIKDNDKGEGITIEACILTTFSVDDFL